MHSFSKKNTPPPAPLMPCFPPSWACEFGEGDVEGIYACAEIQESRYELRFIGAWQISEPSVAPHWLSFTSFSSLFINNDYPSVFANLRRDFDNANIRFPNTKEIENSAQHLLSAHTPETPLLILAEDNNNLSLIRLHPLEPTTITPATFSDVNLTNTEIRLVIPFKA
jgi:hypothetical protein